MVFNDAAIGRQGVVALPGNFEQTNRVTKQFPAFQSKRSRSALKRRGEASEASAEAIVTQRLECLVSTLVDRKLGHILGKSATPELTGLTATRARGASYMKAELEKTENLSLKDASVYAGKCDRMINLARQRGELYALLQEGNSRGFRYPSWQFDVDSARLTPVLQALDSYGVGGWGKHNFLLIRSDHLAGRSPREVISDPTADIATVLHAAGVRFSGEQGAV